MRLLRLRLQVSNVSRHTDSLNLRILSVRRARVQTLFPRRRSSILVILLSGCEPECQHSSTVLQIVEHPLVQKFIAQPHRRSITKTRIQLVASDLSPKFPPACEEDCAPNPCGRTTASPANGRTTSRVHSITKPALASRGDGVQVPSESSSSRLGFPFKSSRVRVQVPSESAYSIAASACAFLLVATGTKRNRRRK